MIKLGIKYKDSITGYCGTAISRHEYLDGTVTYSLQPPVDKDGRIPVSELIWEQRLIEVDEKEGVMSLRQKNER